MIWDDIGVEVTITNSDTIKVSFLGEKSNFTKVIKTELELCADNDKT